MTGNRNANKKEEINEREMQIARISPTIINLNWNNWPVYFTTTTLVLIVLRKRNYFLAYVNTQETQWATPVSGVTRGLSQGEQSLSERGPLITVGEPTN